MFKKMTAMILVLIMSLLCLCPAYAADLVTADAYDIQAEAAAEDPYADDSETTYPEESALSEDSSTEDDLIPGEASLSVDENAAVPVDEAAVLPENAEEAAVSENEMPTEDFTGAADLLANGSTVYIKSSLDEQYVLTIKDGSKDNKSNTELISKSDAEPLMFTLQLLSNGYYVLYNFRSSKVIGAASRTPVSGTNVRQYEYVGSTHQQWKAVTNSDGTYTFLNVANTKLALEVAGGIAEDGANIQLATDTGSQAQRFTLEAAPFPTFSGEFTLRPSSAQSMGEMVAGSSKTSGAQVYLGTLKSRASQIYKFERVWGGYYMLLNKNSGLPLGTENKAKTAGTYVNQYTKQGWQYECWKPEKNSDGTYTFYSRYNSELVLDAGGTASKTRLRMNKYTGSATQKFITTLPAPETPTPTPVPGQNLRVTVRSARNSDRVLNLYGNSTADNTNIQLFDWTGSAAGIFTFVPVTYNGKTNYYYKIQTNNGKVLDVNGGKAAAGANIRQMPWGSKAAQIWHLTWNSDGTATIESALSSSYCLSIASATDKNRANIVLASNTGKSYQRWHLTGATIGSCTISSADNNTVTLTASGTALPSDDNKGYLFAVEPYKQTISGASPITSVALGTNMTFTTQLNLDSAASLLQKKFYVGVKYNGAYRIVSNGYYITNPEMATTRVTDFPSANRGTKKGLKMQRRDMDVAKAVELGCSYVTLDCPLTDFLRGTQYAYNYEGKTYYFHSDVTYYKKCIKKFNDKGIAVSCIFYLSKSAKDICQEAILPSALSGTAPSNVLHYALNTKNTNRKRLEALFACLADEWTRDGCMVANWIYGNESDQYIAYNYTGNLTYDQYHEVYADGFRMFNASIKSRCSNARTYICLDHNWGYDNTETWTSQYKTYPGLYLTKDFDKDLKQQGGIHWDMAMHPYPSPEQDCKIWVRNNTVTNSGTSKQITPLNMRYFASYIKKTYGNDTHVIMSECGLSSKKGTVNQEDQQACAVAYAYYLAEFDKNIDLFSYHREADQAGETNAGWWLGLYSADGSGGFTKPKKAADVFRYMDTKSYSSHVSSYMSKYLGSSWTGKIPGWNASRFK